MTTLRCVCGAIVEGEADELLAAVERHVAEAHPSEAAVPLDELPEPGRTEAFELVPGQPERTPRAQAT